jgi:hypothetical protein
MTEGVAVATGIDLHLPEQSGSFESHAGTLVRSSGCELVRG